MINTNILNSLEKESTWKLFFLSVLTVGIYSSHYCCKQARTINSLLDDKKIPINFSNSLLIVSYTLVILVILDFLGINPEKTAVIGAILNNVWGVMIIAWGFMARNRINKLLGADVQEVNQIGILWTMLFSPYYFNYRLNLLSTDDDRERPETAF